MEISRTQLLEHLSGMTVMEMCDLTRDLEETWGVSATPQQPWQDQFSTRDMEPEEQTEFDVILESYGEKKIQVIKTLRAEMAGLGLKEAKLLTESAPTPIKEQVSKEEAENLKAELEKAGATVTIK
jgi:large subunit ribosomal protein L7/L12